MNDTARRKRKRKPTLNGRFINSSMAYELSLVKLAIEAQSEFPFSMLEDEVSENEEFSDSDNDSLSNNESSPYAVSRVSKL